jgi:hypothetical protein
VRTIGLRLSQQSEYERRRADDDPLHADRKSDERPD